MNPSSERIAASWSDDRAYLVAIATRIIADRAEAEDVVQDAFARLTAQRVEEIDDIRAWLVVVVRRIALDKLGSAHRRLSSPSDPIDLPLGADASADPADRVTLDDEIRHALGVVLDRLTPAERSAFLLHDVFGIPFDRVAELVGRTPGACRQLASRARRSIAQEEPASRAATPQPELLAVAERFRSACAGGDIEALTETLHRDVSGWAVIGGRTVGETNGADAVAARTLLFLGPDGGWSLSLLPMDDSVAVLATRRSEPVSLVRLTIENGLIVALRAVVLPS